MLKTMALDDFADKVADYFLDRDLESVSVKDTAKVLRELGVPSARAIAVRDALQMPSPAASATPTISMV
jgi:hypothetical protein